MKAKKFAKRVCGIAVAILAGLLLLIGSLLYATRYRISDIDAATSPDGKYEIIFQAVGEPDWPFGTSHARIVLKRNGETVAKRKYDVANDGGVLHPENWRVRWEENCVKVILSGEEQSDELYTYYFDGTVRQESLAVREPEAHEPVSGEVYFAEPTAEASGILAPGSTDSSEEMSVLHGQDSVELFDDSVLGIRIRTTGEEEAGIKADMEEIGKLCRAEYLQAEKIPSEYLGQEKLGQEDIDAMEAALSSAGTCVENSDAVYPDYMENAEKLIQFWDDVSKGQDAAATVWSIASSGSVYCRVFVFAGGKGYCIHASGEWDDAGLLQLAYLEKKEILYWDMTSSGFLYQDMYLNRQWTAATLLRLEPVDRDLYAWTEKYIAPIEYHNGNLFLLDWDSSNFGNVCFNDLLPQMARMEHEDDLCARDYPSSDEPFPHSIVPADLFESVIYKHFNISLDEFRERAYYDAENNAYPWPDLSCGNASYYPELIPEVTKVTENADGTVTLLVNVICPDKHTDHLFEHEVTMKIETDGSFQYLSNKIVYRSENELPSPEARMEVRRFYK
jgi:hypothetical protein